jgi:hypothetical protein
MSGQLKLKAASLGGDIALVPTDTASSIVVTIPAVTSTLLNDQSNIEAQTKTALNATGSAPLYGCRAWVNFNGTGTVAIRASGNVSSITDNGTGDYTVNFTTAMQDADYAVSGFCGFGDNTADANVGNVGYYRATLTPATTSGVRIQTNNNNPFTAADLAFVSVSIFR